MSIPLDAPEFERWRAAAQRAFASSDIQAEAGLHEWACFLFEQSAQLAVKGLLHGLGAGAWGHDLSALCARTDALIGDPWPDEAARWAERLSRFYIPTRYPDAVPAGIPGDRFVAEDSGAARSDAIRLLDAVDRTWGALAGVDGSSGRETDAGGAR